MTDSDTTRYEAEPAPPSEAQPPPTMATPPPPSPPPPSPSWRPPPTDSGRNAGLIFGVIILIVGLWYFATNTLDLDLPRIEWGQLWPLVLIGLGAWIVLNALRRRSS